MCGIAGFIDRSCGAEEGSARLSLMLKAIYHRGPDGEGRMTLPQAGLFAGMRRLAIIDLTSGDQPIWNEDNSIGVLFNGEIYNFKELRAELEGRGHRFKTQSDTEVLVHLYEQEGPGMITRLRGMFAFALLNKKKGTVLIGRDHFGQKPLYYASGSNRFAFASELKALRHLDWVDWSEDPDAFLIYSAWLSLPAPRTHFRGIKKLEPGSLLEVDLTSCTTGSPTKPWRFVPARNPRLRDEEAVDAVEEALRGSVRIHLRSDVPVGVFLSGGLDSKLIATLVRSCHEEKLHTFTAIFDGADSEEYEAARTASQLGLPNHRVMIRSDRLGERLSEVARHLDEPIGDPAALAVLQLSEAAAEHVKVVLSGEGSDELFAGYSGRYNGIIEQLSRSNQWKRARPFLPSPPTFPRSRFGRFWQRAWLSEPGEIARMRWEGLPCLPHACTLFSEDQQRRLLELTEEHGSLLEGAGTSSSPLAKAQQFDVRWQLPESLLQKADKMTMARSIELRAPFLDTDVARVAARLDFQERLKEGVGKLVLRKLAQRLDPSELTIRPKLGFPMPFADWFRTSLRGELEDTLFSSNRRSAEHLDIKGLRLVWNEFLVDDNYRSMWAFYALWLYEIWASEVNR
jgi:asparagine synthase (glutamine-hydrolysing)